MGRLLQRWFTVLERYHPTTCTVSDLIVGNSYSFRVFSENLCGLSASAAVTRELAHIVKTGGSGPKTRNQARHHHADASAHLFPALGVSAPLPVSRLTGVHVPEVLLLLHTQATAMRAHTLIERLGEMDVVD